MRELSLFTGAGGGLLGTHLLGWKAIGYVEFNDYCQRVIAARIADGILPVAPIFGDIRTFISEGYAATYQGMVDVITAGFPCQPFSVAGKQAGADDERNMWPATVKCIRIVRPRYAFLENVPGLVSSGYFPTILSDLAQAGYDARWRVLSAASCGAPHKRDRLWILAHARSSRQHTPHGIQSSHNEQRDHTPQEQGRDTEPSVTVSDSQYAAHANDKGLERSRSEHQLRSASGQEQTGGPFWWSVEPDVGRVADGVASRVDRIKALGNGQVPAVVRAAWNLLAV